LWCWVQAGGTILCISPRTTRAQAAADATTFIHWIQSQHPSFYLHSGPYTPIAHILPLLPTAPVQDQHRIPTYTHTAPPSLLGLSPLAFQAAADPAFAPEWDDEDNAPADAPSSYFGDDSFEEVNALDDFDY
jgi:hypothetical protein